MKQREDLEVISDLVDIPLKKLHIQYIPVVTPIELWNYDMSIKNSPHVELLSIIDEFGFDWEVLKKTRYWVERRHRYSIGFKAWDKKHLKNHIKKRWAIYKSLKKSGYRHKLRERRPLIVLKQPFWKTRFELEEYWLKGYHIVDGGGISAAAYFLGYETLPGYYVKDKFPGSKKKGMFEHKLRHCIDRWEEIF